MSEHSQKSRSTIVELVVWCLAVPILAVWALVSLLPMISLIRAWGDSIDVFIALAFLATGAAGIIASAIGYRLLLWNKTAVPVKSSETRTFRAAALSAYAIVWMALYAL